MVIWELFEGNPHSPLFLDRVKRFPRLPFDISKICKVIFTNWTDKGIESEIVEYIDIKAEQKKKKNEDRIKKEETRMEISEAWDNVPLGHLIRGCALITQSILRKYIVVPSLIIAKNIGRVLLLQSPEWFEDIQEWKREMHVKCTYNGIQLSETEFPTNWLTDGIQIKILFPFYLKPWHIRPSDRDLIGEENQKDDFCFLTVWGRETDLPFGSPRIPKGDSFFDPIFKELQGKWKRAYFLVKTKLVSKETKKFISEAVFFILTRSLFLRLILVIILKLKERSKFNPTFSLRNVSESNEITNEITNQKDSRISNQIIDESFSLFQYQNWKNYALTKKKYLTSRTSTIRNQIERITKTKITPSGVYINPTEKEYNAKRFESTTNIWQILKRRNARLISQLDCFIKIFLEKIYIDIFLAIINIPRLNIQFLFESIKKMPDKPINETDQERLNRKNKNIIDFISISTLKKKKSTNSLRNRKNLHSFCDLSYLSQAYVFYKLSQTQVSNKLRSVFQKKNHGISFFIKAKIKDSLETQGILHSKLSHKKLPNSEMNEWKNWLRGHYQYTLSRIKWSGLIPQKWRNRVKLKLRHKNKNSKGDSYDKVQSKREGNSRNSEVYYLVNQKDNFQKNSRYDLLSYKSINFNYENTRDSSISKSSSQVELKKNEDISYKYNTRKDNFSDLYIWRSLPINNNKKFHNNTYINITDIQQNPDRKYCDWKILNFDLRRQLTIESCIKLDIARNQNAQIDTNNYQIIEKIDKKSLVYLTIPQKLQTNLPKPRKGFLDWMGMNEEILNGDISTLGFWFFPEFVLPYNLYKKKPWLIRSKILLLNLNLNENALSEKKNIKGNQKQKGESVSNKKIKNQNRNQKDQKEQKDKKEKESVESKRDLRSNVQKQGNAESVPSTNHEKDIEDPSQGVKKKIKKSIAEVQLDLLLKRFLVFQLRSRGTLNERMMNNINIYCLLLRLQNPLEITISSIQRSELSLDLMPIRKTTQLKELMKKGIILVEPTRLSVKNDGQFIMYQTLGISLAHKMKQQINQGYRKELYVDLLVPETILSHRRRRELRILMSFNSKTWNKNPIFSTENNCSQSLDLDLDKENPLNDSYELLLKLKKEKEELIKQNELIKQKNELMKFKFFLWPNYRLEDLACMNRYWFDTNNGSRFSMLRIKMYPRLKSR